MINDPVANNLIDHVRPVLDRLTSHGYEAFLEAIAASVNAAQFRHYLLDKLVLERTMHELIPDGIV